MSGKESSNVDLRRGATEIAVALIVAVLLWLGNLPTKVAVLESENGTIKVAINELKQDLKDGRKESNDKLDRIFLALRGHR